MATFFVSYAGEDEKWARWVAWELQNGKQRHRSIAQFKDFPPGTGFMSKMRAAARAEYTIALFSRHYFRSRYCQLELDAALNRDRLLPVRVESCTPDPLLRTQIYIDLVKKTIDDARDALLDGVEAFVTVRSRRSGKPVFRRPVFPGRLRSTPSARTVTVPVPQGPLRVLFVAPQVGGLTPRRQLSELEKAVRQARFPDSVAFTGIFDARVDTISRELNKEAPDVFHLSGKQSGGDILIRRMDGGLTTISDTALAGMFRSLDRGLKLVVIDTCFSLRCATTVAKAVPCAMGVEGDIYEDDATTFYRTFYQAVASGRSLKDATAQAQSALRFAKVSPAQIPLLRCRAGVSPGDVVLIERAGRDG